MLIFTGSYNKQKYIFFKNCAVTYTKQGQYVCH